MVNEQSATFQLTHVGINDNEETRGSMLRMEAALVQMRSSNGEDISIPQRESENVSSIGESSGTLSPERELPLGLSPPPRLPVPALETAAGPVEHQILGSPEREAGGSGTFEEAEEGILEPVHEYHEPVPAFAAARDMSDIQTQSQRTLHQTRNDSSLVRGSEGESYTTKSSIDARASGTMATVADSQGSLYVPASASLEDDGDSDVEVAAKALDEKIRANVAETVKMRLEEEHDKRIELLYSPDRREKVASPVSRDLSRAGDSAQESEPVGNTADDGEGSPFNYSIQEYSLDLGVTLTPQRSPVPGASLVMTPEGRRNPNHRVFLTSQEDEEGAAGDIKSTLSASFESPDPVLAPPQPVLSPSRTKSPRDMGLLAPVALAASSLPPPQASSPATRSRYLGDDHGPSSSSGTPSRGDRITSDSQLYQSALGPLLEQMVRTSASSDASSSINIASLANRAYALIKENVLQDVLRESVAELIQCCFGAWRICTPHLSTKKALP